ncbi:MAG: GreA/GreB family elongation factor [Thermoanaerobaculia bacterium]|nr:GreA/GreB family elongation factor [Thermoanaerobaculia bacterium]
MNLNELSSLLSEKKFDVVENAVKDALLDAEENAELLAAAFRGLARASGQKGRLQGLATLADATLRGPGTSPAAAGLRWGLLKEAVRAGATPSSPEGFHKLFEEAIRAAYPESASLTTLLGRFRFLEAKEPADGLARVERAEKWLPFEVGRCFFMAVRGAGKVVETNFALDAVRVDFEKSVGVSIPIGVAAKSLTPLPEGHFLHEKLTAREALAESVLADPPEGLRRLLDSFGKALPVSEVKEALAGLVPEERWTSWWTAARKSPHVVLHGSGKNASVEWTRTSQAADAAILAKFGKAHTPEARLDFFRKNGKRDPVLATKMGAKLVEDARALRDANPPLAYEIAVAIERVEGVSLGFAPEALVPEAPLPMLGRIEDRLARERFLEGLLASRPEDGARLVAEWFFREEDARTLDLIDRRLAEADPATREATLEKLLKSPRSGPKAFLWFGLRAAQDDAFRARLTPTVLGRLLDAASWEDLGGGRAKLRELFDRTGVAAAWLVKQATLEEAQQFLQALDRHNELEPHRRAALFAAAEMRFPDLRKGGDDNFFVTEEALEGKKKELERLVEVDIPENTKGLAIARAEGDLSENFEYQARKQRQQDLGVRVARLQEELRKARVLDPATVDTSEVRPGTRVTLRLLGGTRAVTLLGPWDSRPEADVYSYLADASKGLLGRKVGDRVSFLGDEGLIEAIEVWKRE